MPLGVIVEVSGISESTAEGRPNEEPKKSEQKEWKSEGSTGTKNSKIDKIVNKHHKALAAERKALGKFLHYNGFKIDVNCQKTRMYGFIYTYPLHEAVKQQNAVMVSLLLKFGADPTTKDSYGLTAYGRASKMKSPELLHVFERKHCSDDDLKWRTESCRPICERFPPPKGFEAFFAALECDPMAHKRPAVTKPPTRSFFRTAAA